MTRLAVLTCFLLAAACGGHHESDDGGDTTGDAGDSAGDAGDSSGDAGDAGDSSGDANNPQVDAELPTGCTAPIPGNPQCSNCIDDDNDGFVDAYDIQCSGPLDNNESSFATDIPGDNIDAVAQDCFFDGNSGAGNDGCNIHVCCLLGATTVAECPIGANRYNPADCPPPLGTVPLTQQCIDTCGALTPPGCDCFGCCTICDPNNPSQCYDIITNPNVSPNCDVGTLGDPSVCVRCTQQESCGPSTCGGATCILCPGQTPDDLPPECSGTSQCPAGSDPCAADGSCAAGYYCGASNCCVGIVQ